MRTSLSNNPFMMAPKTLLSLFVGRQRELEHLRQALTSGARAVTISGARGIGKRMLVSVFATQYKDFFPGGVRLEEGFFAGRGGRC